MSRFRAPSGPTKHRNYLKHNQYLASDASYRYNQGKISGSVDCLRLLQLGIYNLRACTKFQLVLSTPHCLWPLCTLTTLYGGCTECWKCTSDSMHSVLRACIEELRRGFCTLVLFITVCDSTHDKVSSLASLTHNQAVCFYSLQGQTIA